MIPQKPMRSWKAAFFVLPLLLLAAAGASHRGAPAAPAPSQAAPASHQAAPADPSPPEQAASEPLLPVSSLPDPPRQNDPWTPPATTLPPELVADTRTLFLQGLADPRGGEYREITVQVNHPWYPQLRTHGWVLPRATGAAQAFAVCWDGQVYPVVSVGPPADLSADVEAMVRDPVIPASMLPFGDEAVSASSFSPLKVCLLLRLGKADLAEQPWAAHSASLPPGDLYLTLASHWAWSLLSRTVDARSVGANPRLALFLVRRLTRIRAGIEGEAAERHLPHPSAPPGSQPFGPPASSSSYLGFLDFLPELLADQEDRARAPKHTPALEVGEKSFPTKRAYIAALIGDLNEVTFTNSGGDAPQIAQDPIVQALIAQGDDAVEPLIQTAASDRRLARLVWMDGFTHTVFRTRISQVALVTIFLILQVSDFGGSASPEDSPVKTAAALQAYWDKNKTLTPLERWYRTLADDKATPPQWHEAADAVVRPTNVAYLGYGATSAQLQPGVVFPLRGEPLRARYGSSISRLIARRVPQIAAVDWQHPWLSTQNAHNAALMALDAARWDARAALPALRAQAAYLGQLKMNQYGSDPQLDADQSAIALARRQGGDRQALADYTAWLLAQSPETAGFGGTAAFEPLWRCPHDPAVTAAAARLFDGPTSPWKPFLQKRQNTSDFGEMLQSPLLGVEAFRRSFFVALGDKTEMGKLTLNGQGWWSADMPGLEGSGSLLGNDNSIDRLHPKNAQAFAVRRCDVYAWRLSHLAGMPRFELYWPQAERDAVIAQAVERLRHYGSRFEYQKDLDGFWDGDMQWQHSYNLNYLWDLSGAPLAHLGFSHLDHPATPAEAAHGDAIFSLAGEGERRLVPLPHWPLPARWVTDRRYPQTGAYDKGKPVVSYQQDGLVWQAEEVQRNGKWQRFYGFVGPHDIARVPAEQIEFPMKGENRPGWLLLSRAINVRASLPDEPLGWKVGAPLPITLTLYNRSGLPQRVPTEWVQTGAGGPALRQGMRLRLYRVPAPGQSPWWVSSSSPMPLIRKASFSSSAAQMLDPAQERPVQQFDLRDWYDLSRPGWYLLDIDLYDKQTGFTGTDSVGVMFQLTEAAPRSLAAVRQKSSS